MRKKFVATLFGVAMLAVIPAPAFAIEERSLQDDQTFVYNWFGDREQRLAEFKAAGGDIIRINLLHVRGPEPLHPIWGTTTSGGGPWGLTDHADMAAYDAAVDAILARGLKVQMTLVWYGQSDPQKLARWMARVAQHFAGRVFRFSILNEPDLTLYASDACDPHTIRQMVAEGVLTTMRKRVSVYKRLPEYKGKRYKRVKRHTSTSSVRVVYKRLSRKRLRKFKGALYRRAKKRMSSGRIKVRFKRVRRYKGKRYRRVKQLRSTGRIRIVYRRSRKGMYRRYRVWKQFAVGGSTNYEQTAVSVSTGCLRVQQARKYRQIVQAAASAIRAAAPGAEVCAGETSPGPGSLLFIDVATRRGLPVNCWLHHPYDGAESGIYNGAAIRAATRMPVGYSEFGYTVNWPDKANALRRAWQQAQADGAFQMNQYGYNTPLRGTWNTSLQGDANLLAYIMAVGR